MFIPLTQTDLRLFPLWKCRKGHWSSPVSLSQNRIPRYSFWRPLRRKGLFPVLEDSLVENGVGTTNVNSCRTPTLQTTLSSVTPSSLPLSCAVRFLLPYPHTFTDPGANVVGKGLPWDLGGWTPENQVTLACIGTPNWCLNLCQKTMNIGLGKDEPFLIKSISFSAITGFPFFRL